MGVNDDREMLEVAREECAALERELGEARANPRDDYHTMAELYEYRMLYNALAFNAWAESSAHPVVKSWRHSDGELCFGGGWFVVVATLPTGIISNHYKAEHWDVFHIPEGVPPEYDGHTPSEAAARMRVFLGATAIRPAPDNVGYTPTTEQLLEVATLGARTAAEIAGRELDDTEFRAMFNRTLATIRADALRTTASRLDDGNATIHDIRHSSPTPWTEESANAALAGSGPIADWIRSEADRVEAEL